MENTKRISIFLITTFLLTCGGSVWLISNGGLANKYANYFLAIFMMIPAISVLFTQLVTKESFKNPYLKLHFAANAGKYILCFFLIQLLIIFGAVVYFLLFPDAFDGKLTILSKMIAAESGQIPTSSKLYSLLFIQTLFAFLSGPIINILFTFGEEYGWRGYLFPKLCKNTSPVLAALYTGIIWGVWHAPMITMGHNYGKDYPGYPILGIFAMILFCIFLSFIFSYFTYKTKSVFPSVIMHSALNAFASIGAMVAFDDKMNAFVGPLPTGIVGGCGLIICGTICAALLRKEKNNE